MQIPDAQGFPHLPQFFPSFSRSAQYCAPAASRHAANPCGQLAVLVAVHFPWLQAVPDLQTMPQPPQLLLSVYGSEQYSRPVGSLQSWFGAAHGGGAVVMLMHCPAEQ